LTKSEEGELTDKEQERIPEIYKSEVTKAEYSNLYQNKKQKAIILNLYKPLILQEDESYIPY
jgi:hypothetical protein